MKIPDYVSPIVAYRVWGWDGSGLASLSGESWPTGHALTAQCKRVREPLCRQLQQPPPGSARVMYLRHLRSKEPGPAARHLRKYRELPAGMPGITGLQARRPSAAHHHGSFPRDGAALEARDNSRFHLSGSLPARTERGASADRPSP